MVTTLLPTAETAAGLRTCISVAAYTLYECSPLIRMFTPR